MSDLIDAIRKHKTLYEADHGWDKTTLDALDTAIKALEQPEIIRCKDCKHWGKRELCDKWDYYISNDDFYCGCAERRTDGV